MDASTVLTFSKRSYWLKAGLALLALLAAISAPVAGQNKTQADSSRNAAERDARRRPAPAPPAASIFFCQTRDVQCRTEISDFGLDQLRDLFVFVAWRGVSGEHVQQVRFLLPDGNLYQAIETRFTTLSAASAPDVQAAVRSRGEPTVISVLPVAGTHITQRSLAGTWTVQAYLDGKPVAQVNLVFRPR